MSRLVLIVDDDSAVREWLEAELGQRGMQVVTCASGTEAVVALGLHEFDAIVTDLNMPKMSGVELCRAVADSRPDIPVIVLTGFGSIDTAVEAMRAGAYDYLTKPLDVEALAFALDRAIQHHLLREELRRLRVVVGETEQLGEVVGTSAAMRRVYDLLARIRDSDASVLVTGESGTGKEVIARALHERGHRKNGPFVAINLAAVPETLLESELFGHARGAFTDAKVAREGLFVQAHGGTLFLDEIGELPLGMQAKILRALQERRVRPVGGSQEIPFDVRIVAATNRDLESAVEDKRFREDLYYRIHVIHVELPPLRARGADVLLLAQRFVRDFALRAGKDVRGISERAGELLLGYSWPGNVRELQNCIERAVALTLYPQITVEDLPAKVREHKPTQLVVDTTDPQDLMPLEEVERRYILRVLEACKGNKTMAGQILKVDRKTLQRKMGRWMAESTREDDLDKA